LKMVVSEPNQLPNISLSDDNRIALSKKNGFRI
jgi:hypothetical protein